MKQRLLRILMAGALAAASIGTTVAPVAAETMGDPGDPTITVDINDSTAGGTYEQVFERAYVGTTTDGTDVFIYVPLGALEEDLPEGVASLDPAFDHNPDDDFIPCADNDPAAYEISQAQIDALGDELTNQIVAVDEAHFGDIGLADDNDPDSDALVLLVYNVQDDEYYDCSVTTYTAGYFAPEYITEAGMNVIVVDAFDWANRIGDQEENPAGVSFLYEGVIAHELEHLLHNYTDEGELSWVDEGLADMAAFLNDFQGAFSSHLLFHQVLHRETSLTRWGGGLENYGAAFTYFLYLWEQAGGNGDGSLEPDGAYDNAGGDLLIKLIFENAADGMEGVQNAIDEWEQITGEQLRSAEDFYNDWVIAIYQDDEDSELYNFHNIDFGPDTGNWTVSIANDVFWGGRGQYKGATPNAFFLHNKDVPQQTALPFGVSYETFRNAGPTFSLTFDGEDSSQVAPHTGSTHWYGGYESLSDNVLDVDYIAGNTLDFWTWYFIEEGWDYGFVEALVNGEWVTVPLVNDAGDTVTTSDDPHDNNEEGNGLTGTSGGTYFVDDPSYIHLTADLPEGTTDVQFRYSTDAAYLDTGWFVDDVQIDGAAVSVSSDPDGGEWIETTGEQDNNWVVQILSPCDLTPNEDSTFESTDETGYIYRLEGDEISETGFSTACLRSTKAGFVVAISNLPTGDLTYLDADYVFRLTNTSNKK